jgi:Flp pilus assembly protein TadG
MKRSTGSGFRPAQQARTSRIVRILGEEGAALYELAWSLPLLLALVVGIIYGGITFYDYVTLADAVSAGARTLATSRTSTIPCTAAQNMLKSSALNLNQSNITINITFAGTGGSCCPGVGSCPSSGGLKQGDTATVNATYPCLLKVPIVGFKTIDLCPKDKNGNDVLTSSTTVLIE